MSGHSKWSTIKRKKAVTDAKRGKLFSKISRQITVAVKEKGVNREHNIALRLAIEKARQINMPSETIARIIAKSSGEESVRMETVRFEASGPGGSAFVILGITDSKNRASQTIKHALAKHGAALVPPGSLSWVFAQQGEIIAPYTKETKERVALAAIESGAEDVKEEEDGFVVITKPENLHIVLARLEEQNITTTNNALVYAPKQRKTIVDKQMQNKIRALIEALEENDDVQEVYDNVTFI